MKKWIWILALVLLMATLWVGNAVAFPDQGCAAVQALANLFDGFCDAYPDLCTQCNVS